MICPICQSKIKVVDTIHNKKTNETYRRRKCTKCNYIFYTIEFEVERTKEFMKILYECDRIKHGL